MRPRGPRPDQASRDGEAVAMLLVRAPQYKGSDTVYGFPLVWGEGSVGLTF